MNGARFQPGPLPAVGDLALARHVLERYEPRDAGQAAFRARMLAFVDAHPEDAHERSCLAGHLTASALLLDSKGERALLTLHKKLGRWLQLGGHVDGEERIELAALREAQEESGMQSFELVRWTAELVPLDLDVHPIPARRDEARHDHWDVRFLLRAAPGQQLRISEESNDLRWVGAEEVAGLSDEDSVLRLQRKARAIGRAQNRD